MEHTVDTLMALADEYTENKAEEDCAGDPFETMKSRRALVKALTEALAQPVRERKVMSKAFCNQNQFDGEELAYSHDYLNE
jgi:hypothetical protein